MNNDVGSAYTAILIVHTYGRTTTLQAWLQEQESKAFLPRVGYCAHAESPPTGQIAFAREMV
jgi:hypothetical protein